MYASMSTRMHASDHQIASLQKEHVELLLRKQQAMTTVFAGHADMLKNALMRENYSDVLGTVASDGGSQRRSC